MSTPESAPRARLRKVLKDSESHELRWATEADSDARRVTDWFFVGSVADSWNPAPVVLKRGDRDSDFVFMEYYGPAVTAKARELLAPVLGDSVEFLPLKVVAEGSTGRPEPDIPVKEGQTYYLVHPLVRPAFAPNAQWLNFGKYASVSQYAFEPAEVSGQIWLRAPGDTCILISEEFHEFLRENKLTGLYIWPDPVFWLDAGPPPAPPPKKKKTAAKSVPAPKAPDFDALAGKRRVTKSVWQSWVDHWNWICDAVKARQGEVHRRPKMAAPLTDKKLATLQKKIGRDLPVEFADVLGTYSARVEFSWSSSDDWEDVLPEALLEVGGGGGDPHTVWDTDLLVKLASMESQVSPSSFMKEDLRDRLPFYQIGNGDLLAFDMRDGNSNCPVVYLSHENDDRCHNARIGTNFIDFMTRWSYLGCPGPEHWCMEPFYDRRTKHLKVDGPNAKRWRKWLETGK